MQDDSFGAGIVFDDLHVLQQIRTRLVGVVQVELAALERERDDVPAGDAPFGLPGGAISTKHIAQYARV